MRVSVFVIGITAIMGLPITAQRIGVDDGKGTTGEQQQLRENVDQIRHNDVEAAVDDALRQLIKNQADSMKREADSLKCLLDSTQCK